MVMTLTGFMSGCSELEEIEERGFVVGAAWYREGEESESNYERDVSNGTS